MEVVYCDNCNVKIAPNETGQKRTDGGKVYCAKCAPLFDYTSSALLAAQLPVSIHDQSTKAAIPVSRSENPITKFYFCETCGKRITDKELDEGLGRDKKLKGVYCRSCAVGVMTMEMNAVNIDALARAKPKNVAPVASMSAGLKASTSNPSNPSDSTVDRSGTEVDYHHKLMTTGNARVRRLAKPNVAILGGSLGVVLTITLVLFLSSGKRKSDSVQSNAPLNPSSPAATISQNEQKAPIRTPPPTEPPLREPVPEPISKSDPEALAKADYDNLVNLVGSMKSDTAGRISAIDAFLKNHNDSSFAEQARALKDGITAMESLKEMNQSKTSTFAPDIETSKAQTGGDPQINSETCDKQFANILKELTPLLRRNQFNDADKFLTEKLHDPSLAGIVDRLKNERSDLAEVQALRSRAMEALRAKAGTIVTLKKGTMTGSVVAGSNKDNVGIALKEGPELAITSGQLDSDDVCNLLPIDDATKAEELRRRGLLFLAAGEAAKAEEYFMKAKAAGMESATAYLERIAVFKRMEREEKAVEVWKHAEDLFEKKSWKDAKQAYEMVERDYAGSAVLMNNLQTLKKRLDAIEEALGRSKEINIALGPGLNIELVLIPAGEFVMGNDLIAMEKPAHKVKISRSFYMGKYAVTQAQYEKVMGKNPSHFKGESLPVDTVSASDAEEFCKKVSSLVGMSVRLPAESEWEYACFAGKPTKFTAASLDKVAWFFSNSGEKTHPVGQKKPNEWGLYDMLGNVFQWCAYESYTKEKFPPKYNARGGSFCSGPEACTGTFRYPGAADKQAGFRIVIESRPQSP